jgi:hypothetical protein
VTEIILAIIEAITIFFFGIFVSCAFAGIQYNKKNVWILSLFSILCCMAVLFANSLPNPIISWRIMPLLVHIPNLLLLVFYFHKRFTTSLAAVCTAFLLCQPPRWMYTTVLKIIPEIVVLQICIFLGLFILTFLFAIYLSQYISKLFNKDNKSVSIFGSIPILYYVINYFLETETNFWSTTDPMIAEFFRFFLCIAFLLFCVVYYKEYEQKLDLERKEQIINISFEQQKKEMALMKEKEQEIRILRHDMRLYLNTLIMHIKEDNTEGALKLASTLATNIDATKLHYYCKNDTINYILSEYAEKCDRASILFQPTVHLANLPTDEIMFSSILSNGLDNAINASVSLPIEQRCIKLMLKTDNGKLLLSIRNHFEGKIIFSDGVPVSNRAGHGYGTQSICYMTEKLGGNYQFMVEDNEFILRVVI